MASQANASLSRAARALILVAAVTGWFFGGIQIAITNVAMRAAAIGLMDCHDDFQLDRYQQLIHTKSRNDQEEAELAKWNTKAAEWFAWYQCAFLFGAAAGGFLFGRLGDGIGRSRALAVSIIWFSALTAAAYFVQTPTQLFLVRFLACLGVGGTWPNGVSLVSEVWGGIARPLMASLIGLAGNLGILAMATAAANVAVTPDSWRWVMVVGALPMFVGIAACFTPESPSWQQRQSNASSRTTSLEIFSRPYLGITLIGVALATVPLMGGWGSANWMVPWAGEFGAATGDDFLKGRVVQARSLTSIVGSGIAGWLAISIGRRVTYFVTSVGALLAAQLCFWFMTPGQTGFLACVALLGLFNGIYFGWLPYFLPELFETRIRSTGAGVSFNFGRILTALTIFVTGATLKGFLGGYAEIGRLTSLVFAVGMFVILLAPDTTKRDMAD